MRTPPAPVRRYVFSCFFLFALTVSGGAQEPISRLPPPATSDFTSDVGWASESIDGRAPVAPTLASSLTPALLESPVLDPAMVTQVSAESAPAPSEVTAEQVARLQREAEAATDLTEETRKQVAAVLAVVAADLQLAADQTKRAETLRAEAATVPERLATAQEKLKQPVPIEPAPPAESGVAELDQHLARLEATLTADKKTLANLADEPQTRSLRRKEVRARSAMIDSELTELAPHTPTADESAVVTGAQSAEVAARRQALSAESLALQAELAKYDAEDAANLVRVRTDAAARRVAELSKAVAQSREAANKRREKSAEESVRQARLEAIVASPLLKEHAELNSELTEKAHDLAQRLSEAEQELKAVRDAHAALDKQYKQTLRKVDGVASISSVGALLRKQRKTLPSTAAHTTAMALRRPVLEELEYEQIDYEDTRDDLADIAARAEEIVAAAPPEADVAFLTNAATELLEKKRGYLDELIKNCGQYIETLSDLNVEEERFVELVQGYQEYIDENVLWIRSGKPLTSEYALDDADLAAVSPERWAVLGRQSLADLRRHPWAWGVFVLAFVGIASQGRRLRRSIAAAGEIAEKANCRSIVPTIRTAINTALVAAIWPALLLAVGWRLQIAPDASGFAGAVGEGLWVTGVLWAPLELLRQVCRARGLGESHFGWSRGVTGFVRRRLRAVTTLGLPAAFATTLLGSLDAPHARDSLERTLFLAGMAISAAIVFAAFAPGGLLKEHYAYNSGGWAHRLRRFWPLLAAAAPLTLGALTFTGYYYTATTLAWRGFETGCFLATVVALRAVLLRMLLLRRRQLAMVQAKERAQAAAAAAASGAADGTPSESAGITTSAPQADLVAHSEQTRRLVTTGVLAASVIGLWLIWSPALPALQRLDEYKVWGGAPIVHTAPPAADPVVPAMPGAPSVESPAPSAAHTTSKAVTLADLALAVLIVVVTVVVARNGPGLLEMSVLQQLPMEPSVRYAITTLVSYAIVLAGVISSCSTIGLEWSQVQWLATALTFGLAFGLQEMFANFVAGLIILLERPIRVGDVVTVDNVTGVVSRIRIRATSITDWDRKEYVVPNKEFITGRLLNWTLSDKTNRIVINIGVAYGTDTERAREILLQVANDHPLILKEPKSMATFEGFGDNTLNLVLRTYLPTLDGRLDVIHHLHTEINRAFAREGIEIAFPQRDLHIRSAPAAFMKALQAEERSTVERKQNAA